MPTLTEKLGLSHNPFQTYIAEKEPNIDKYIVRPPYHKTLVERAKNFESFVLFGARGAGKSASRLALYREMWEQTGRKSAPLPVTLDGFERILARGIAEVSARDFVLEIAYLTVESVLLWLSSLTDQSRETLLEGLTSQERSLAAVIVNHYYRSYSETERQISSQQASKLLNQAWSTRGGFWVSNKWSALMALVGTVVDAIVKKKTEAELQMEKYLPALLSRSTVGHDTGRFAHTALIKLVEFVKLFGFSGIVVLIDKVDETRITNNSSDATARLLYPLLANSQLLEIDGLAMEFFLWDRIFSHFSNGDLSVRLDKVANASISWDNHYLTELINQRLQFFSDGKIAKFKEICESDVDEAVAVEEILRVTMQSPRELMRALDTIIREHDNSNNEAAQRLTISDIAQGINRYCIDWAKGLPPKIRRELTHLGKMEFINSDVQSAFRCNANSARSRILQWIDSGFVVQSGTRTPDGVGKPAFEYKVLDRRIGWIIDNGLFTGDAYDDQQDG